MSSREPMWYCYECNAEMRPLMAPDPHCASCNGTFVEKMDNPEDDPREFAHTHDDEGAMPHGLPELNPMIAGLSQLFNNAQRSTTVGTRSQPASPRSSSSPAAGGNTTRSSFRFEMTSGSGGNSRTFVFGGPNTLGTPGSPRPGLQEMPSSMRRSTGPGSPGTPGDISGPMMAQYLLALIGGMGNRRGNDGDDPFAALFGAMGSDNGRWGDYAFSQEALDQIITEIMENSNTHRPVPAPEDIVDKLPRTVLGEGSPILEKDCAVCKEQFALGSEDPDEQVVIDLPCKHPFHQGCILPWLKSSGTCPVCRYALVAQPDATGNHNHNPSDRQSSSAATPLTNAAASSSGDGTSGNEGGGILNQLMGYIRGSQPNASSSQSASRGHDGGGSSVPGGWDDQVD